MHVSGQTATYRSNVIANMHLVGERYFCIVIVCSLNAPLPIFASYYAFVIVSLLYKFTRFFIYFLFLSDEEPMVETFEYTIRIGRTPNFFILRLGTIKALLNFRHCPSSEW